MKANTNGGVVMKTDVVVIGAGAAGIAAALTLAENNKKVILLEKGDKFGGAGMFGAQGLFAVQSYLQKQQGQTYSVNDAYLEMMNYTHYRSNAKMTKRILQESAQTISWLKDHGLETELVNNTQEVHQAHPEVYHQYIDKFNGFKRLMDHFLEKGGVLKTKTSAETLIFEDNQVKGVVVDVDGKKETIQCQAVIACDGGFVGDKQLVDKYWQNNPDDLYSMGERKATGDGIKMLQAVGADTSKMGVFENHAASVISLKDRKWHNNTIFTLTNLPFLWVDKQGQRFVNEDVVYDFALWGNVTNQVGGSYYYLLDQKTVDYLKANPLKWTNSFERTFQTLAHEPMTHQVGPFATIETDLKEAVEQETAIKADSLEELAQKLGFAKNRFVKEVQAYNQSVANKNDEEFGKAKEFLEFGLEEGPFYAVKARQTTLGTIGGLMANADFEVLNKAQQPIKGAFAAGNNVSGMYDNSYPTLEGISCAFAWNSGRIAGQSVSRLLENGSEDYYG